MKIIAHRGFKDMNHENTLEAFQYAIEQKADYIEFDLHRTKDNIIVIFHDAFFKGKLINNYVYSELLEASNKAGFKIPTFEETLKLAKGKIKCDIELKEAGYEKEILDLTLKYLNINEFIISSFIEESLGKMKELNPDIETGLIIGADIEENKLKTRLSEIFPSKQLKVAKANYLIAHNYFIDYFFITRFYPNYKIWIWTDKKPNKLKRYIDNKKIDGIIIDAPAIK